MSLNIRYLTNGEKNIFVVYNKGIEPPTKQIYSEREDIDINIRHYAPDGEPKFCNPDMALMFGVIDELYPEQPNCIMPEYSNKKCISDSCKFKDSCEILKSK